MLSMKKCPTIYHGQQLEYSKRMQSVPDLNLPIPVRIVVDDTELTTR